MERLVQIDCGKTFREITAMRVYRQHGVKSIDAVLLTHDHADAVGGLDELRSLQPYSQTSFEVGNPIRLVCDRRTLSRCRHMFPYLFPAKRKPALTFAFDGGAGICQACELDIEPGPGGEAKPALTRGDAPAAAAEAEAAAPVVKRFVAKIEWESFGDAADLKRQVSWVEFFGLQLRRSEAQTSDEQAGLCSGSHSSRAPWRRSVACMPVMHGADYVCFGFGFGPRGGRCVYLSDYTALLPPTEELLLEWSAEAPGGGIELLVLDALRPSNSHPVHASMDESVALARRLRPRRALLVGMGHAMEHRETNRVLRRLWHEEALDVQLAYDGQFVPLDL